MSEDANPMGQVIAVCRDLMDRSKIAAAYPDARIVPKVSRIPDDAEPALVLVDLSLVEIPDLVDVVARAGRVVGFASHVDEPTMAAAREAGVDVQPRSVFFRRLGQGPV